MLKNLKKRLKDQRGLTLVELLAVIVILGVISAIAVPAIGNIIENSKYKAIKADAIMILNAAKLYQTENDAVPTDPDVDLLDYLEGSTIIELAEITKIEDGTEGLELTTAKIDNDGVTLTFTGASIKEINNAPDKYDALTSKIVGTTTP